MRKTHIRAHWYNRFTKIKDTIHQVCHTNSLTGRSKAFQLTHQKALQGVRETDNIYRHALNAELM